MKQKPAAVRDYLFSGKEHNVQEVKGARFLTAEALSGFITYLNRGNGAGFPHPDSNKNTFYTLRHEVRTDIALWLPDEDFFQYMHRCQWHNIAGKIQNREHSRFEAGMKSALHAILRGIILSKTLKDGDVAGLVCPDPRNRQVTGQYGFVLFDNSSGGAGSVQSLALTGIDSPEENMRLASIQEALREAIKICANCSCESGLNHGKDLFKTTPRSREDYLALSSDEQQKNRVRVSCYRCLKSFNNQRDHVFLDRHDAREILEFLEGNLSKQGGGGRVGKGPNGPTRGKKVIKEKNTQDFVLRSTSEIPKGQVRIRLATPRGVREGEARILIWTKEGDKLGVKIKIGDSEEIQISNQELDANDVLTIYA